jgi:hypothetical protein
MATMLVMRPRKRLGMTLSAWEVRWGMDVMSRKRGMGVR